MTTFARTDTSVLGRWWWTVDRWTLVAVVLLMGFGAVLVLAASPAAAARIGLGSFQLAQRQLLLLPLAVITIVGVSLLEPQALRRLAVIGLGVSIALLTLTLLAGPEIKGATRWLSIAGMSFQPSEFAKPFFAVVAAWMLAAEKTEQGIPGTRIALALWAALI